MFFVKQNAQSQVTSAVLTSKQVMALKSGDLLLLHWESHCSKKKSPNSSDHKNEGLVWRMCSYVSAVQSLWCRARWQQSCCQEPGDSTKHQELSSAAFPTCLASTGVGVSKDLLKEYKNTPPGAITLNFPFQVLSINRVPQSNPAGTLKSSSSWSQIKLSSGARSSAALWCLPISPAWEWAGGALPSHAGASQERRGVNLPVVAVLQLTDLCRVQVERRRWESSPGLQRSRVL